MPLRSLDVHTACAPSLSLLIPFTFHRRSSAGCSTRSRTSKSWTWAAACAVSELSAAHSYLSVYTLSTCCGCCTWVAAAAVSGELHCLHFLPFLCAVLLVLQHLPSAHFIVSTCTCCRRRTLHGPHLRLLRIWHRLEREHDPHCPGAGGGCRQRRQGGEAGRAASPGIAHCGGQLCHLNPAVAV